jgi:hypothetical protein
MQICLEPPVKNEWICTSANLICPCGVDREHCTLCLLPDTFLDLISTVAKLKTHTGIYAKHTVLFAYQIRAVFISRDETCNMLESLRESVVYLPETRFLIT